MPNFIPYHPLSFSPEEQLRRAQEFFDLCNRRRTVREYSSKPVARELLETLIRTAGTAPSGANKQPWRFVVVTDPSIKREIRIAAEKEEKESYEHRMPQEWLDDLAALGTDWHKEFLEIAPALIVVFTIEYEKEGAKTHKNYYVKESVGLAVGLLLTAIHNAGLVSLTHTPSPMNFLQKILHRPVNERPFLLIPVGYPAEDVKVPDIQRKRLEEIVEWKAVSTEQR
ncbi:MAG: nitroreductase family protein [Ignavibacteria bacterium]|nr:nitroreductase family protein [Ignavibacteria bacterium]